MSMRERRRLMLASMGEKFVDTTIFDKSVGKTNIDDCFLVEGLNWLSKNGSIHILQSSGVEANLYMRLYKTRSSVGEGTINCNALKTNGFSRFCVMACLTNLGTNSLPDANAGIIKVNFEDGTSTTVYVKKQIGENDNDYNPGKYVMKYSISTNKKKISSIYLRGQTYLTSNVMYIQKMWFEV